MDLSGTLQGAGGVGGLVAMRDSATNTTHGYVYDGNGNVHKMVNLNSGTTSAGYEYGPFGEPVRATGEIAQTNRFRFSTKYVDNQTELVYYGYRYYATRTGAWISRDQLWESAGANLYINCLNNLGQAVDPLGNEIDRAIPEAPDHPSINLQACFDAGLPAEVGGVQINKLNNKQVRGMTSTTLLEERVLKSDALGRVKTPVELVALLRPGDAATGSHLIILTFFGIARSAGPKRILIPGIDHAAGYAESFALPPRRPLLGKAIFASD